MSSGNLISHQYLKEATYGVINPVGNFQAISKTSTNFTCTPDSTQSSTVRDDRLPSGNIITGLTANGSSATELSRTVVHDDFIEACMMNTWSAVATPITRAVAFDSGAGTLTATAGDFTVDLVDGDVLTITGLIAPADDYNSVMVFTVTNVTALVLSVTTGTSVEDWDATAGAGAVVQKAQSITIGKTVASFSFEKQYLDLTDKAIDYLGQILSSFSTSFSYGSTITQDYNLMGSGKTVKTGDPVCQPSGARDVYRAPPEKFFNVATGMPYISVDGTVATYCIESIDIGLDNGLTPRNCVGKLAKTGYDLGEAGVTVSTNMHFSDNNWNFLDKIMNQTVVNFEWPVIDEDGLGYHYQVSAQLTADDPDTTGKDAQAMLNLSGAGAIGDNGTVLTIWKIGGDLPVGTLI